MSLNISEIAKAFVQGSTHLTILSQLSLEVKTGEVVAVVGESGSGKSTLLSLIAGFEPYDAGDIFWNQTSTKTWTDHEWSTFRKSRLGFVFQNYHLIPYLTALENVELPLRLMGQTHSRVKALSLLERMGLQARGAHLPNQMSGGERQRVAIARALVHSPELVLADEPTGSLDVKTGAQVLDFLFPLLREFKQSALVVTHSQDVAQRCDRVLTLREGRLWSS